MTAKRGTEKDNHTEDDGGRVRGGVGLSLRPPLWLFGRLRAIVSDIFWDVPTKPMLSHGPMSVMVLAWFTGQDRKTQLRIVLEGLREIESRGDEQGGSGGLEHPGTGRGRRGIGGTRMPDRDVKDKHSRGVVGGHVPVDDHAPAIRG